MTCTNAYGSSSTFVNKNLFNKFAFKQIYWYFWNGYNGYRISNLKNCTGTLVLSWYSRGRCDLIIPLISWFSVREEIMDSLSLLKSFEKQVSSSVIPEWLLPESVFANVTYFF